MTQFDEALLVACSPADLLPERRRIEAERIELPLNLLASASLGENSWFLVVSDQRGIRYGVPAVVENGVLRRAVPGDGASESLLAMALEAPATGSEWEFEVFGGSRQVGETGIEVDQTNELIRVGDAMVKWNLHPTDSTAPGPICSSLLHDAGFGETPRPWANVRMRIDGELMHVASVVAFIPDTEDGWDWAVTDVRRHARGELDNAAAIEPARVLGDIIARMHAGLSRGGVVISTTADSREWRDLANFELGVAVALENASGHPALALLEPKCLAALEVIGDVSSTPLMRIHGDLHIGQILRTMSKHGYLVIDFDGNPTQDEVVEFQPAARDVAGMLCSLDHVARVVIHRTDDLTSEQVQRILDWIPAAEAAFLDAYTSSLAAVGSPELFDTRLVAPLRIQQECREYIYADRYLPHWRYVPEAALPALLDALTKDES